MAGKKNKDYAAIVAELRDERIREMENEKAEVADEALRKSDEAREALMPLLRVLDSLNEAYSDELSISTSVAIQPPPMGNIWPFVRPRGNGTAFSAEIMLVYLDDVVSLRLYGRDGADILASSTRANKLIPDLLSAVADMLRPSV